MPSVNIVFGSVLAPEGARTERKKGQNAATARTMNEWYLL